MADTPSQNSDENAPDETDEQEAESSLVNQAPDEQEAESSLANQATDETDEQEAESSLVNQAADETDEQEAESSLANQAPDETDEQEAPSPVGSNIFDATQNVLTIVKPSARRNRIAGEVRPWIDFKDTKVVTEYTKKLFGEIEDSLVQASRSINVATRQIPNARSKIDLEDASGFLAEPHVRQMVTQRNIVEMRVQLYFNYVDHMLEFLDHHKRALKRN